MAAYRPVGRTGTLPHGTPSEHHLTQQSLIDRGLKFSRQSAEDFAFDDAWAILSPFVSGASKETCRKALTQVLKRKNFKDESAFDTCLFDALARGLKGSTSVQFISKKRTSAGERRKILVLDQTKWQGTDPTGWRFEFAIAFATQVTGTGDLSIPKNVGCASSSRHDHSAVIVRRRNVEKDGSGDFYGWNIVDSLATVGLKRRSTSTELIKGPVPMSSTPTEQRIRSPIAESSFGALWQTIAYVISDVWTCVARKSLTVNGETPSELPFAIIACDEKDNSKSKDRFVVGNVLIPTVCGEDFSFNLMSSKKFGETDDLERAAAAYVKVLGRGVVLGTSYERNDDGRIHSLNGLELRMFDTVQSSFTLEFSPLTTDSNVVTQGEIWSGTIPDSSDIQTVIGNTRMPFERLKFVEDFDEINTSTPLLIKSVSTMIHNPFIRQDANWRALLMVVDRDIVGCVNQVLLAAERSISKGTQMLMRDLRQHYRDLRPNECSNMKKLWEVFANLVRNTMLVLAREHIIHPDIRPGNDFTSNIMLNSEESEMVLIDLDSLVLLEEYQDFGSSRKYLSKSELSAFGFVWWQCFVVSMAWKLQTPHATGCADRQDYYWEHFGRANSTDTTEQDVLELLAVISSSTWFDATTANEKDLIAILHDFA